MTNSETCVFCDLSNLKGRIIRSGMLFTSFVSDPWFRPGQCLVIPNRHATTPVELEKEESAAIMQELGRLSACLDEGFGTGIIQKYQPLQPENGIKVNHLHFHVFPRKKHEAALFPVPEPNSFEGFTKPSEDEMARLIKKLS